MNQTTNAVAYLPSATVTALMGGRSWDSWTSGLRIIRRSGINDRWFYRPVEATVPFAWSVLQNGRHGCGSAVNRAPALWRQVGGANLSGRADLLDNISGLTGNDCNRVFTSGWVSHGCVMGFSSGDGCDTGDNCWTAGGERHCIPLTTVWVRD